MVREAFGITPVRFEDVTQVDVVLVANNHRAFDGITLDDLRSRMDPPALIDIKARFDRGTAEAAGFYYRGL